MDIVRRIETHNAGREPERLALKYRALRRGSDQFFRGTCALFYDRLPTAGVFRSAPPVWACGDLHLENFGSYKGDNRLVYFDINDFDESALAPASWELVRMLTSIQIAGARLGAGLEPTRALSSAFLDAYSHALTRGKALWIEREIAKGLVGSLLDRARARRRKELLDRRTFLQNGHRRLNVDGTKALPATDAQRDQIVAFMADFGRSRELPSFFNVLDVARRIAGTGSLGVERYAILVEGKGSPDGNYLLDLKAALPSSLESHLSFAQPAWATQAERAVAVQRLMQVVPMAFLQPVHMSGQAYVLRALQPSEDRIAIDRTGLDRGSLADVIGAMGRIVAWAQLRSSGRQGSATADDLMVWGAKRKWKARLTAIAEDCAQQCQRDAVTFATAYDDGVFTR